MQDWNEYLKYNYDEFDLLEDEIWKPIDGFKDHYISNKGRFFREARTINGRTNKARFLKIKKHNKNNTMVVSLLIQPGNISREKNVARLLLEHFVDNPDHFKNIGFKDNDFTNINLDNLEWSSKARIYEPKTRVIKRKKRPLYYQQPIWVKDFGWEKWETLEDVSKTYNIKITDILDVTNNKDLKGIIKGISRIAKGYDVEFSFNFPYPPLKYELHGPCKN